MVQCKHGQLNMLNMVNTIHCAAYTPLQQPVQNLPCNVYRGGLLHTHTESVAIMWLPRQPIIGKFLLQHRQMKFIAQLIGQGICWPSHSKGGHDFAENWAESFTHVIVVQPSHAACVILSSVCLLAWLPTQNVLCTRPAWKYNCRAHKSFESKLSNYRAKH